MWALTWGLMGPHGTSTTDDPTKILGGGGQQVQQAGRGNRRNVLEKCLELMERYGKH